MLTALFTKVNAGWIVLKTFLNKTSTKFRFHSYQMQCAFSQVLNTCLLGYADETTSSRSWRWHRDKVRSWPMNVINLLYFWDTEEYEVNGVKQLRKHCEIAYLYELEERQKDPEFRSMYKEI